MRNRFSSIQVRKGENVHVFLNIFRSGFNPVWNETFQFKLTAPELTFFRFVVMDQDLGKDDFVAQASFPFSSIRPGKK